MPNICTIFQDVTGSDSDRAGFFLESSNWDLDVAVGSFFESGGEMAMDQAAPAAQPAGNDHLELTNFFFDFLKYFFSPSLCQAFYVYRFFAQGCQHSRNCIGSKRNTYFSI